MARTCDITPGCQDLTRSCRVLATMTLYDLYVDRASSIGELTVIQSEAGRA